MEAILKYILKKLDKHPLGKYLITSLISVVLTFILVSTLLLGYKNETISHLREENESLTLDRKLCEPCLSAEILAPTWLEDGESLPVLSGQLLISVGFERFMPNLPLYNPKITIYAGEESKDFINLSQGERRVFNYENKKVFLDILEIDNELSPPDATRRVRIALSKKV